jgi:hypothetical protein
MAAKKREKTDPCSRETAETLHGKPYFYLEAPGTFQIEVVGGDILGSIPDKEIDQVGSFWVECEYIRTNGLPLDPRDSKAANPRAPDCEHAVVAEMKSTLLKKPWQFTTLNGGISIVCDKITPDTKNPNLITVTLQDGDGIVNGGHTYYSINSSGSAIKDSAYAKIEIVQIASTVTGNDRRNVIKNIAVSKNKNRAISDESEANFLGYFEPWKKAVDIFQDHISWKDGATCTCVATGERIENPLTAQNLIKLMFWFEYNNSNFHMVYNNQKRGPKQPSKSQWNNWLKEVGVAYDPIGWMMPLALPILELRERVFDELSTISKTVPMTSLVKQRGRKSGGPRTVIRKGRAKSSDFGEWLLMGRGAKENTVPSFFDTSINVTERYALAEMIFGNFRSLLWRKNTNKGEVLVGWQVNPKEVWDSCRDAIIGSLYYEWFEGKYTALTFPRNCQDMFVIDFCEWVEMKLPDGTKVSLRDTIDDFSPPWRIYHGGKDWACVNKGETPTMWLSIHSSRPEFAEFSYKPQGSHTTGYIAVP